MLPKIKKPFRTHMLTPFHVYYPLWIIPYSIIIIPIPIIPENNNYGLISVSSVSSQNIEFILAAIAVDLL